MPELTLRALMTGCVIGVILAASNVYVGLKIGYIDPGNVTAAVVGFALFAQLKRFLATRYSALEANLTATTAASAAMMGPVAGLVGPLAALELMGHRYPAWAVILWGLALALLGIVLGAVLRERLIVSEKLQFPTGAATAEVIRSMDQSASGSSRRAGALFASGLLAAAFAFLRDSSKAIFPQAWLLPGRWESLSIGLSASPLLFSTGVLIGFHNGISLLVGAAVAWACLAPAVIEAGIATADFGSMVGWLLWPGAGLMVASALTSLAFEWKTLLRALRDLAALRGNSGESGLSRGWIWACLGGAAAVVILGYGAFGLNPAFILLALVLSLILASVCARAAGQTDMSPAGAMGGLTQLLMAGVAPGQPVVTLFAGSVVNGTATETSTVLWSLKAGRDLGATPRNQLLAQLLGALAGAAVVVPAYFLVVRAYGLGTPAMPAGAVLSWKATAEIVAGGTAAFPRYALMAAGMGALAGVVLTLLGQTRMGRFLPSPIGMGIGFLVPASYSVTLFLGSAAGLISQRRAPQWTATYAQTLAAGGIAGESLMGILLAAWIASGLG